MKFGTLLLLSVSALLIAVPLAHAVASDVPVTALGTDVILPSSGSASAVLPAPVPLVDSIDQNQPSGPSYMANFSQGDLAQSFIQTNDTITGAGILLQAGAGSSDNVTIQLWTALPNAGGTMVAEGSATGTNGEWVDVFWDDVDVTPITYYLVFTGNTTLGIAGSTSNPYPDGCVYANTGFTQFPSYDYAFRTYYETDAGLSTTTWAGVKTLSD